MTSIIAVCAVALGALAVVGWVVGVAESAPNISELKPQDPGGSSEVFAADGTSLGFINSTVLRTVVHNNQIPRTLKLATVAIEDRRFYKHKGVDYQGILRAAVKDVLGHGSSVQGGSTLTMQLVRNLYLPKSLADTKTLKRKIIEAKLAEELEKHHDKSWILTNYLNDVDYGTVGGQSAYGVGAASEMYFNRPVWTLDLAKTAMLAGLPQAPSLYNPFLNPQFARRRRHDVLHAMVQAQYISAAQARAADAEPLGIQHSTYYQTRREPFFFDYVHQALIQKFCPKTPTNCPKVDRGGLKIYTTLDLKRQQEAKDAIERNEGSPGDPAATLVTIDPNNGHIVAMASSISYNQDNFNYAAQAHRQTGSSFKPVVLMTAIHDYDADPNQTYYNSHELFPGWTSLDPTWHVQTSEHSYAGNISLTQAMTISDNTVYAQLDVDVGPTKVRDMAYKMGITSHLDGFPAEGIGGMRTGVSTLEMADVYATIANGGYHIPPTAITKVVFQDGSAVNLGDPPRDQVFSDGEAYTATNVLKTVIESGTGTAANYGCPAAGKTGTTTSFTDAWFVGYTPKLSTAVWVGYPKRTTSMYDVNGLGPGFGGTLAAPIWHDYMANASDGYCSDFPPPQHPFSGTAFSGDHAQGGQNYSSGSSGDNGSGSGSGSGGSSSNSYSNPNLYSSPPQPPASTGGTGGTAGNGGGGSRGGGSPPAGFGTGHAQGGGGSGGAGIGH